jgi:hypothetical protein
MTESTETLTYTKIFSKIKTDIAGMCLRGFNKQRFVELEENNREYQKLIIENEKLKKASELTINKLNGIIESIQGEHTLLKSEISSIGLNPEGFIDGNKDMWSQRGMVMLAALVSSVNDDFISIENLSKSENPKIKAYLNGLPDYNKDLVMRYYDLKNQGEDTDEVYEDLSKFHEQHGLIAMCLRKFFNEKDWYAK